MSERTAESPPNTVEFNFVVTLGDHTAFDRFATRTPAFRRKLARIAIAGTIAAPGLAFVIALIARGALAGSDCDLDQAMTSDGRLRFLLIASAWIVAIEIGAALGAYALRSRSVKAGFIAKLSKRPGVDPADTELSESYKCMFGNRGVQFVSESIAYGAIWTVLDRVEETIDHMFVLTGPFAGFIIPKRDVPPGTIIALRETAKANGKLAPP